MIQIIIKVSKLKKIVLIAIMSSISFSSFASTLEEQAKSGNIDAAYKLAELNEKNNNIKEAMYWYKKVATLSLKNQQQLVTVDNTSMDENTHNLNATTTEPETVLTTSLADSSYKTPIISDRLTMHQDYETKSGLFGKLDSSFGLRPYHSNYILPITYDTQYHKDGRKQTETAFQISFKKDVFQNTFGLDETIGFAYTQRNWWQTTEKSSPFRETNYLPELYVQMPHNNPNSLLKGSQFGFVHESNGQGNEAGKSRSWNRLYLEGYFQYKESYFVPRVWYRIPEDKAHDDNRDIEDYMGYGDLTIFLPYQKNLVKLMIRNNLSFNDNRGAIQIDWTYPLWDTGLYGYVQYFNGYGESLIDYNKTTNRLGIGIALSR